MEKRKFIHILKGNVYKKITFKKQIVDVTILKQILRKNILKRIINRIVICGLGLFVSGYRHVAGWYKEDTGILVSAERGKFLECIAISSRS
jgi:hypothetical protein